jgi:integrase
MFLICGLDFNRKPDMPFGNWVEFWYKNFRAMNIRANTKTIIEEQIKHHIIPYIGSIPLNKLTQNDLHVLYASLKKNGRIRNIERHGPGLSNAYVRQCHQVCRGALEKAGIEGLIQVNPAIGCDIPSKKAAEMKILSKDEIQRLLIQSKAEGYFELIVLELSTGLRRGEIVALQWNNINFNTGELRINKQVSFEESKLTTVKPKTKTSLRTIVLAPSVLSILQNYRKSVDSRWLFPSPVLPDRPIRPDSCGKKLTMILEHADCKHVRFHDLRHTFSTLALENGMDVKSLSTILGHVSAATTLDIYSHITDDMQMQAAAKIDRHIGHATEEDERIRHQAKMKNTPCNFKPYMGKIRKPGTGCITEINDHLYEGKYSPTNADGKRTTHNVYAHTRDDCEEKLAKMILLVRAEIDAEIAQRKNLLKKTNKAKSRDTEN